MLTKSKMECWPVSFTLLIILHIANSLPETTGRGKGAICKMNEDCDRTRFLECDADRCGCRAHSGWIWVPEEQSCMIMESAPCGRRGMGEKCAPHSSCVEGNCECDNPYLRNGFGRCERSWGMSCSESEPCSKRYSLVCPLHKGAGQRECECLEQGGAYVWDMGRQKCVSTAGGACDLQTDQGFGKDNQLECIRDSSCTPSANGNGACQCKPGFKQSREGHCYAQYGEPCDISNDPSIGATCNRDEGLLCQENKCACEFYGQMRYEQEFQQCRFLVGESCSNQSGRVEADSGFQNELVRICVKDAFCKPRPGSSRGICTCKEGFEPSPDLTCSRFRRHGQSCSSSIDCDKEQFMECSFNIYQEQSGRCECFHNQMRWDGKQCRVLPGKSCTENPNCTRNSYCDGNWCVCNTSFLIDPSTSECTKELQKEPSVTPAALSPSNVDVAPPPCDLHPERTPEWKKCQCELSLSTHIWQEDESSCLALVGSPCQIDSHCIPHATCDPRQSTCQCSHSALTTKALQCIPAPATSSKSELSYVPLHTHPDHHDQPQHNNPDCPKLHTLKSVRLVDANSGSPPMISPGGVVLLLSLVGSVILSQYCAWK